MMVSKNCLPSFSPTSSKFFILVILDWQWKKGERALSEFMNIGWVWRLATLRFMKNIMKKLSYDRMLSGKEDVKIPPD